MSTATTKTEIKLNVINLTKEQKEALSATVKKQNESKVSKLQNSSFWNLKNALTDKGSAIDKEDLKLDKISPKVQRKLRNSFLRKEQLKCSSNFLKSFNAYQLSNTNETRDIYQIAFVEFNKFNKRYLVDCNAQYSNKSDDSQERKDLDLAYSYYFQVTK